MVIFHERVAELNEAALSRFLPRARRAARLRGAVNLLITNNAEMRRLNRQFRGKDRATDVLSFPAVPGLPDGFAGDVAVSAEIAADNARRFDHTTAEEIKILALHGILHLAGYDHEHDHGLMAEKEMRLRRSLGLPEGLIERGKKLSTNRLSSATDSKNSQISRRKAAGLRSRRNGAKSNPLPVRARTPR